MRHRFGAAALVVGLTAAVPAFGQGAPPVAQAPLQPQPTRDAAGPALTFFVRDWFRGDSLRFFDPKPGGGDPSYDYAGHRLQVGVQRQTSRYEVVAALQYAQVIGLPTGASGPGQLGIGATYYETNGRTDPGQAYLRYANVKFKNVGTPGLNIQVGRMPYTSGSETASGDPKIEAVKRQRLDSRMIGEFEWSLFQRGFDGGRLDYRRPGWEGTAAAFHPTQGGFERRANADIGDITIFAGTLGLHPGRPLPHTEFQVFTYRYDDARTVAGRPDNEGRTASHADLGINSVGTTAAGAYPVRSGQIDVLAWMVAQTGTWYDRSHRAYAFAFEGGHQWTTAPWKPWLRAGVDRASGDRDGRDGTHGTFFPMMPTGRKYALSATYAFMNLDDRFVQAMLRPAGRLGIRLDLHQLNLAQSADRWYTGSGATQASGTIFGYSGRPAQGGRALGTVAEGSADLTLGQHWSVNVYVSFFKGRDVIQRTFSGDHLTYIYFENVISLSR